MEIGFFGAAQTVTGSKFFIHQDGTRILVDCGLFQGPKSLRLQNRSAFPFDAHDIKAVILTHAHLDHCGALPLLVAAGFNGPIYCTAPTAELTKVILMDAAKIQEEEAEYANKKKFSKHTPALPLFDSEQAERVFPLFHEVNLHEKIILGSLAFELFGSGHILGASSVLITGKRRVYFSGDLGRSKDPLMFPPEGIPECDVVIMESTYGDRLHDEVSSKEVLLDCIQEVEKNRGVLLIPSFSVGRAQNLVQEIIELREEGKILATTPVYFNSPMGLTASQLYADYSKFTRLDPGSFHKTRREVQEIKNAQESISLNESPNRPLIIIAASGMLTGGRVLHHVRAFADDPKNIILLAGFQAMGTRGRDLLDGKKEIKIHGALREINCKVVSSDSFSAHADQKELLFLVRNSFGQTQKVFLVHGEVSAQKVLQEKNSKGFRT